MGHLTFPDVPNESVEKDHFFKAASSAGLKIGNYLLSAKVFGSGNKAQSQLLKKLF
jgi:hypothetical protein